MDSCFVESTFSFTNPEPLKVSEFLALFSTVTSPCAVEFSNGLSSHNIFEFRIGISLLVLFGYDEISFIELADAEVAAGEELVDVEVAAGKVESVDVEVAAGKVESVDVEVAAGKVESVNVEVASGIVKFTDAEFASSAVESVDVEVASGEVELVNVEVASGIVKFTDAEFASSAVELVNVEFENSSALAVRRYKVEVQSGITNIDAISKTARRGEME